MRASNFRMYTTSARLTHLDEHGRASMVDVDDKAPTKRSATATGRIFIPRLAYELVTSSYPLIASDTESSSPDSSAIAKARQKGDALTVAQIAAIMGSKQTSSLIPLCHPLSLSKVDVKLIPEIRSIPRDGGVDPVTTYSIRCTATVTCEGKTGVEMEALTAVSVGLLTVWDMLKAVGGKEMVIGNICVTRKTGGRSGDFERVEDAGR